MRTTHGMALSNKASLSMISSKLGGTILVGLLCLQKTMAEPGLIDNYSNTQCAPVQSLNETMVEPALIKNFTKPQGATGQSLMLDLVGSTFEALNDEERVKQATVSIIEQNGMSITSIDSFKLLDPEGVKVVATSMESHLTISTWAEEERALVDFLVSGPSSNFNFQDVVPMVIEEYGGNLSASTYSIFPRGHLLSSEDEFDVEDSTPKHQFEPRELMAVHRFKKKVFEMQSPFQHIAIWDHHIPGEDGYTAETTRSLFLDHVIQSNVGDEWVYHESLVHPAFVASPSPPKRVLIVGGGEGGTLRESLKWSSVEHVTMVDLDAEIIKASQKYLPSYSNCTGFGSPNCFEDDRLVLHTEDFFGWFEKNMGHDICENREEKKDDLYDVIILDLLDPEEIPEGEDWGEYLYSDLFFKRTACALNPSGVIVTNIGESPDNAEIIIGESYSSKKTYGIFAKKIEQIQSMSSFFGSTRVYETFVPSFRAEWSFALGMVPNSNAFEVSCAKDGEENGDNNACPEGEERNANINNGVESDFDEEPCEIDLKLMKGLINGTFPLDFYGGTTQHKFQYSLGGWDDIYCADRKNDAVCDATESILFRTDPYGWCKEHLAPGKKQEKGEPPRAEVEALCYSNEIWNLWNPVRDSMGMKDGHTTNMPMRKNADSKEAKPSISGCHRLMNRPQGIHNESVWEFLQDTYRSVVGDESTIVMFPKSGIVTPYEVRHSPGKGRGLFSTAPVKKGTLFWSHIHHAVFPDEDSFRRFLESIPWELACDVLQWAYVEKIGPENFSVAVELDQGSLCNHGDSGEANIGGAGNYGGYLLTLRDMEIGEEFLQDYNTFDNDDALDWFDDMVSNAWMDESDKR
mmetsp:Transcript_20072/g.28432  ORF Transcript_20072/g.28432 Transcript_20072/m.28432 type:complete len:859 (+) Transcript_20072:163-2739(+)